MSSPVYLMMSKHEQFDICLVAVMDMMLQNLIERNKDHRSRKDRYERIRSLLLDLEGRYEGSLPEEMINMAERFNKLICADLNSLIKMIKEK